MKRKFLFVLLAALTCISANAALKRQNNYLEFSGEVTATAGKEVVVNILMTNNLTITSWQTELVLPAGVTFVKVENTENWADAITTNGNLLFSETETAAATGQKVAVAKVTLKVDASVVAGEYEIALDKIVMTASDESTIDQKEPKAVKLVVEEAHGIKGDVDGNGAVGLGDIEAILAILAGGADTPAADVDENGSTGLGDIEAILNILAGGGN